VVDIGGRSILWHFVKGYSTPIHDPAGVNLILGASAVAVEPVVLNGSTNEIPAQSPDSRRARQELGWARKVSLGEGPLRTGDRCDNHPQDRL
jgi:hypothetical protein